MNLELDVPALRDFIRKHGPIVLSDKSEVSLMFDGTAQVINIGSDLSIEVNEVAVSVTTCWLWDRILQNNQVDSLAMQSCEVGCGDLECEVTVYYDRVDYDVFLEDSDLTALIAAYETIESGENNE